MSSMLNSIHQNMLYENRSRRMEEGLEIVEQVKKICLEAVRKERCWWRERREEKSELENLSQNIFKTWLWSTHWLAERETVRLKLCVVFKKRSSVCIEKLVSNGWVHPYLTEYMQREDFIRDRKVSQKQLHRVFANKKLD